MVTPDRRRSSSPGPHATARKSDTSKQAASLRVTPVKPTTLLPTPDVWTGSRGRDFRYRDWLFLDSVPSKCWRAPLRKHHLGAIFSNAVHAAYGQDIHSARHDHMADSRSSGLHLQSSSEVVSLTRSQKRARACDGADKRGPAGRLIACLICATAASTLPGGFSASQLLFLEPGDRQVTPPPYNASTGNPRTSLSVLYHVPVRDDDVIVEHLFLDRVVNGQASLGLRRMLLAHASVSSSFE